MYFSSPKRWKPSYDGVVKVERQLPVAGKSPGPQAQFLGLNLGSASCWLHSFGQFTLPFQVSISHSENATPLHHKVVERLNLMNSDSA